MKIEDSLWGLFVTLPKRIISVGWRWAVLPILLWLEKRLRG